MRFVPLAIGFAVLLLGCGSVANPRSCLDGLCNDQEFPFCDSDAQFQDVPGLCISVECNPNDFVVCRGDLAITCNATGNDYELVQCPHGCDASGCIPPPQTADCTTNAECSNPAPICGDDMSCRGCDGDDECASTICERTTGACTAETAIVYASPNGSGTSDCTQTSPCELTRAIGLVTTGGVGKTLRMLPGNYTSNLDVRGNVIVNIVAPGAVLAGTSQMIVLNGANVSVRDLAISSTAASHSVECGDGQAGAPLSRLVLDNVTGVRFRLAKCAVRMTGGSSSSIFTYATDATLDADGVRFLFAFTSISGQRVAIRIVNSTFVGSISLGTSDPSGSSGSTLGVAFSSFVFPPGAQQNCDVAGSEFVRSENFENNIFYSQTASTVVLPRRCVFTNNIMFPQSTPITNNVVADPQLVDVAGGDYRLTATSPALNTAIPSSGLGTNRDFNGVMRPQGAAPDIGAFERVP